LITFILILIFIINENRPNCKTRRAVLGNYIPGTGGGAGRSEGDGGDGGEGGIFPESLFFFPAA